MQSAPDPPGPSPNHPSSPGSAPLADGAVASLVFGLASIVVWPFAFVCGPLALIHAARAEREAEIAAVDPRSRNFALAGRITGWIGMAIFVVCILLFGVMLLIAIIASAV